MTSPIFKHNSSEGSVGKSTHQQTNFIGGEWSETASGRADDPRFSTALGKMRNAVPTEQGAYKRRSGTQAVIPTRNRNYAKLIALETSSSFPYIMEFTNLSLRFMQGSAPIYTNDSVVVSNAVTGSGEVHLDTATAHGWSVGDDVMFFFPIDYPIAKQGGLRGVVCQIAAVPSSTSLWLGDETGAYTLPSGLVLDTGAVQLYRIFKLTTTITGSDTLRQLRAIQTDSSAIIVQSSISPKQITITTAQDATGDPVFAYGNASFVDGPYDALKGVGGSVSALTGSTTFTPTSGAFVAADVGRHIRLFSEPLAWAIGTTYAYGDLVKYNNQYWQSLSAANTGHYPGSPLSSGGSTTTYWAPAPSAARWVWGTVTAQGGTTCTLTLTDSSGTGGASGTIPTLNGVNSITDYQLGLFQASNYPTIGTSHEGRLWLSGIPGNRVDASMAGTLLQFSLTDQYGTVNDNNAISYTLNSSDNLQWMRSDDRGIVCGALKGEWLISASTGDDNISPTNIKSRRVTKYQCAFVEPVEAGSTVIMVQRYRKHIYEYLVDSLSGRFSGKPINDMALPFAEPGVEELAYTAEPTPIIWSRMADGSLAGCTYRRISRFATENPIFDGWHGHDIGDGRLVEALCSSANPGSGEPACASLLSPDLDPTDPAATADLLYLVTNDSLDGWDRMIEVLRPVSQESDDYSAGWYADEVPGRGKHVVALSTDLSMPYCTAIGGLQGVDGYTTNDTEPPDIGNRSLLSTTLPPVGDTARPADIALAMPDAVYFNGYSRLRGFPKMTASKKFSLSVWLNYIAGEDGLGVGQLLGTPFNAKLIDSVEVYLPTGPAKVIPYDISTVKTKTRHIGIMFSTDLRSDGTFGGYTPGVQYYCQLRVDPAPKRTPTTINYAAYLGAHMLPAIQWPGADPGFFLAQLGDGGSNITSGIGATYAFTDNGGVLDGKDLTGIMDSGNIGVHQSGWFHLMVSAQYTSCTVTDNGHTGGPPGWHNFLTNIVDGVSNVWVNDTEITNEAANGCFLSSAQADWPATFGPNSEYPWTKLSPDWSFGGREPSSDATTRPDNGRGLKCGVTELWFDNQQFLDWTDASVRAKFHKKDLAALTWVPADLGARGQTPTGTKPLLYCTGGQLDFPLNRARKNAPLIVDNDSPSTTNEETADGRPILESWIAQFAPKGAMVT